MGGVNKRWAYGVMTVPSRRETLLPKTLASLKAAGFDRPRLFVDGCQDPSLYRTWEGLDVTTRWPTIRTAGNWTLAIVELYIREPSAERYAIFQDDIVACRNLRGYLDRCPYPERGYWNLYTWPQNSLHIAKGRPDEINHIKDGWYESNQRGLGALGLVFSRDALLTLLHQTHLIRRPMDPHRGWKAIDGGIVEAMAKAGWREWVHHPSLFQHCGRESTMEGKRYCPAVTFRGEGYDAMEMLKKGLTTEAQRPRENQIQI